MKDVRWQIRRHFSDADEIRRVLDGLRSDDSIGELCRKEGSAQSPHFNWSKGFMEAGNWRLAGDTARAATTGEVQNLRCEACALKECVANLGCDRVTMLHTPRLLSDNHPNFIAAQLSEYIEADKMTHLRG